MNPRILAVLGAGVLAAALLMPRRAQAMTDVEEQDTSDVPRTADFNSEIIPAYPTVDDGMPVWGIPGATIDPAPSYAYSWESDLPASPAPAPAPSWEPDWPVDYYPWEGDYPVDYYPWENEYPIPTPAPAYVESPYIPWESDYPIGAQNMPASELDKVSAFLFMIKACEHVYPRDVLNDACYGIFYSGNANFNPSELLNQTFFGAWDDHPVVTGVCKAVPLPATVCQAAGLNSGCVSTAAGAYQIIRPTWRRIRTGLPDFSPASQDQAAIRLLEECGAMPHIMSGDLNAALMRAAKVWASLPGSTAQQNPKKYAFAVDRFNEGLSRQA